MTLDDPLADVTPTDIAVAEVIDPAIADPVTDRRRGFGVAGWFAIGWLGLILFLVIFADLLPLRDPYRATTRIARLAPGQDGFLLGADANRRDFLARLVYGGRNSLAISVFSVVLGFMVGGLLGLLSGYYRNWIGKALSALFDILLAIPALVLAMALVSVLKGDPQEGGGMNPLHILIFALGIVAVPLIARITRAATMSWAQRDFVTAARAQGATDRRIIFREILPNVLPAMVYIALLGMAISIVAEGSLAILGASVELPETTWGVLILEGKDEMNQAPFLLFIPIIVVFLTVLALNFLGDVIRDRFDVRESAL